MTKKDKGSDNNKVFWVGIVASAGGLESLTNLSVFPDKKSVLEKSTITAAIEKTELKSD